MRKKKTYAMKRGGNVKPRMMRKGGNVKPRMMKKGGNIKMMSKGGGVTMSLAKLKSEAAKMNMKLVPKTKKS